MLARTLCRRSLPTFHLRRYATPLGAYRIERSIRSSRVDEAAMGCVALARLVRVSSPVMFASSLPSLEAALRRHGRKDISLMFCACSLVVSLSRHADHYVFSGERDEEGVTLYERVVEGLLSGAEIEVDRAGPAVAGVVEMVKRCRGRVASDPSWRSRALLLNPHVSWPYADEDDSVAAVFTDHFEREDEAPASVSAPPRLAAAAPIRVGDFVAFPPSPPAAHFKAVEPYTVVRATRVSADTVVGVRMVHSTATAIGPHGVGRYFATKETVERAASEALGVLADAPEVAYEAASASRFVRLHAPDAGRPPLDLSPGARVCLDPSAWRQPEVEAEAAREAARKAVAEKRYDERAADPERYPYVRRRSRAFKYPGQHDGTAPYCLGRVVSASAEAVTVRKLERRGSSLAETNEEVEVAAGKVVSNFNAYGEEEASEDFTPLRALDVFAGCGGLSEGLRQSGFAKDGWAIEMDAQACATYKANHPDAVVLQEDCTDVLARAMRGETKSAGGLPVPQKGEVDVVVGGPPCQGYSTMNRYGGSQKYRYRNSLVATFVSFCDFYRPKLFMLENVPNLAGIDDGRVLGLLLQSLLEIGYQATFTVLQAGRYGAPQCRRRFVLVAVPYDAKLPQFPAPTHTFSSRYSYLNIDTPLLRATFGTASGSGLYPRVTIRDAIGDLATSDGSYASAPEGAYQRRMREGAAAAPMDHEPRKLSLINQARVNAIPADSPGADWRDLPDDVVRLADGSLTKRLERDPVTLRVTDASQKNTLIPWSLVHTADRNSQWAGNCGRLVYDGYFLTTLTRPEMLRKQGTCTHPELDRLVTVRECARGQGFPDSYVFKGTVAKNCMQIGNAVAIPMARALGTEFKKYFV